MDNPKVRMSFYLQPEEAEKLKLLADKQGTSTSMCVRLILSNH